MRDEMTEGFRLSPQQEHLWSLQQADHGSPYRAQCVVLIEGPLDVKLLEAALRSVFARHEIFRTTISCLSGMTIPVQVIAEKSTLSIDNHDLSSRESREQAAELELLFQAASNLPRDSDRNSPAHISLATLSADKHMLFVSLPALCADRATLTMLVRELSRFYSAFLRGETLAVAAMQYADVAQWKNELLESADTRVGREHWRKQNLSSVPSLSLPFEHHRSRTLNFNPRSLVFGVETDLMAALRAAVGNCHTSTSIFLLTCWQTLLWRLTSQPHFIVAVASDGRDTYDELRS